MKQFYLLFTLTPTNSTPLACETRRNYSHGLKMMSPDYAPSRNVHPKPIPLQKFSIISSWSSLPDFPKNTEKCTQESHRPTHQRKNHHISPRTPPKPTFCLSSNLTPTQQRKQKRPSKNGFKKFAIEKGGGKEDKLSSDPPQISTNKTRKLQTQSFQHLHKVKTPHTSKTPTFSQLILRRIN